MLAIYCMSSTDNTLTTSRIITSKRHETMKRTYRNDMSQQQRDKLSAVNKGKRLSTSTKEKISKSMMKYWSKLPYKPGTSGQTEPTPPDYYYDE